MSESLTPLESAEIARFGTSERFQSYLRAGRSDATWRAYESDLRCFAAWVDDAGVNLPIGGKELAEYLDHLAQRGLSIATLKRRIAAIAALHRAADHDAPHTSERFRILWRGMRRSIHRPREAAKPLWFADLVRVIDALRERDDKIGLRDRAMILVGWATGARRSELVGFDLCDISHHERGYELRIQTSKTDQEGKGRLVPLFRGRDPKLCPVTDLSQWIDFLQEHEFTEGPVFRPFARDRKTPKAKRLSTRAVSRVLKRSVRRAGMDDQGYSGHSLRSGFAASARAGGAHDTEIARVTGHRSAAGLQPYLRHGDLWSANPAGQAGL